MDSSADAEISDEVGLGDDDFVNQLKECGDIENPTSSATAKLRNSPSPANPVPEENTLHREPNVLPDGRHICPYCGKPYKNRATYMKHNWSSARSSKG
jgi:hypothetical protein